MSHPSPTFLQQKYPNMSKEALIGTDDLLSIIFLISFPDFRSLLSYKQKEARVGRSGQTGPENSPDEQLARL